MGRECFNCVHYKPTPHEGWKPPEYDPHAAYSFYNLSTYLRAKGNYVINPKAGWPGHCRRDPVPVDVRSIHYCGSWVGNAEDNWIGMKDSKRFMHEEEVYKELAAVTELLKQERKRSVERFREIRLLRRKLKGDKVEEAEVVESAGRIERAVDDESAEQGERHGQVIDRQT